MRRSRNGLGVVTLGAALAVGAFVALPRDPADAAPQVLAADQPAAVRSAAAKVAGPGQSGTPATRRAAHNTLPQEDAVVHAGSLRAFEWRQLHRTPLAELTKGLAGFRAIGGTTVALDVSYVVDISEIPDPATRAATQRAFVTRLTDYVAAAAAAGLDVEALAGSPHWISPEVRYVNGIVQAFVASFNRAAPDGRRLVGVHFDLEPWGTPAWPGSAAALTGQLLATVAEIAQRQRSAPVAERVPVSVDLPFWLDGTTAPRTVRFGGRTAAPTEHVMRLLDNGAGQPNSVVIMAYRDRADGIDGSAAVSAAEMKLAQSFGGRVVVTLAQEIGDVAPARITFFQEGKDALLRATRTLRASYGQQVGFGGFAIDDLASLPHLR